ncbi:MAG: arginine deiminase-related protein [Bacteroidales bacterium]|jgi:hypothetical protein|nr:arginine deiminase-related protein [Bacteroidales bacterium]
MCIAGKILMIEPAAFSFNEQTALTNVFQTYEHSPGVQERALREFTDFVSLLKKEGIEVKVIKDTPVPHTPDSIFPNNLFSTHTIPGGRRLVFYPMSVPDRRSERKEGIITYLEQEYGPAVQLQKYEKEHKYLEGTGSLVLDRKNRTAYCCLSPRSDKDVLEKWAALMDYDYIAFEASDNKGVPIYHTNVMMGICSGFAVVCGDLISNPTAKRKVFDSLEKSGRRILEITPEQMERYAGNILELRTDKKDPAGENRRIIVMSQTARKAFSPNQLKIISGYGKIVSPSLETIERIGGGSARCMMAELF